VRSTFTVIADRNQEVLRNIASDPSSGIVNEFYQACMNTAAIEKLGSKPLLFLLPMIDRVVDNSTMMLTIGRLHSIGVDALFDFGVDLDAKNPKTYIAQFFQGVSITTTRSLCLYNDSLCACNQGLSLPDRSLYLDTDSESADIRSQYLDHISRMFKLAGYTSSAAQGQAFYVLQIETRMLNKHCMTSGDSWVPYH
jgi:putative endopeptidase